MAYTKKSRIHKRCCKCNSQIPSTLRSDALYCSSKCRSAAEKARYCSKNPEYVAKQRKLVTKIRHKRTYGHTDFMENPLANTKDRFRHARALGYRSGLEVETARYLDSIGIGYKYEAYTIEWEDLSYRKYTPDIFLDNGIIIETKGVFTPDDRRKHLEIKKQHPELDIRFVFSNAKGKLYKGSKTCYSKWCEDNGFQWAHRVIPQSWLLETGTPITDNVKLKTQRRDKL